MAQEREAMQMQLVQERETVKNFQMEMDALRKKLDELSSQHKD